MKNLNLVLLVLATVLLSGRVIEAQTSPTRVGTTVADFLELGFDPKGIAMGDASVSTVNDLSAIYWNPAGLAFMARNEVFFAYQPWIVDTKAYMVAGGFVTPSYGTFAASAMGLNYGEMEVTTVDLQEGTGEVFSPADLAVNISYGRRVANWFGFGATVKYISSSIHHSNAQSVAADLGVIINTGFLAPTGSNADGLKIGMSISNYGTRMRYRGLDLLRSYDESPDEAGNYKDVRVEYVTESWELPLIFRIGLSMNPIISTMHRLTIAVDALHPNNNSESVNIGATYAFTLPGAAKFFLRGGYRSIFLEKSEFGPTFGAGLLLPQRNIQFDYAYRDIGVLGFANVVGLSILLN
ncbi:PorV/PorQ family protein [Candidatus Neomarinimicrobiota bacterium]